MNKKERLLQSILDEIDHYEDLKRINNRLLKSIGDSRVRINRLREEIKELTSGT